MDPELVDRIYESSFVPELWPGVLDELAKIAGGRVGWLCVSNGAIHHWDASPARRRAARLSSLSLSLALSASGWDRRAAFKVGKLRGAGDHSDL
jgi:hypothetical protein